MIRNATISDFDFIYRLYMSPETNPYLLYEWMSESDFRPIFEDLIEKKIVYIYGVENQSNVGMFKLGPFMHRTSHIVYLGGVAVDPNCIGKGFGQLMLKDCIAFAIELGYKRIELSTAIHNLRAIAIYEKLGFVKEGVMRDYTYLKSENRYIDEVLMSYILDDTARPDPPKGREKEA